MSDIGLLVSAKFPYTDGSGAKTRPGLVIGEHLRDYLLAPVSKEVLKYGNEPMSVMLDNDGLDSGRLKHQSVVRSHKTLWVEKVMCQQKGRVKSEVVDKILRLHQAFCVTSYYQFAHTPPPFILGTSRIPYAGRVYDEKEMIGLMDASLDFWLTAGRHTARFEKALAGFLGVKHCCLANSGSSANLLAFMALTSAKLGDRCIKPGDEVITVAAGSKSHNRES